MSDCVVSNRVVAGLPPCGHLVGTVPSIACRAPVDPTARALVPTGYRRGGPVAVQRLDDTPAASARWRAISRAGRSRSPGRPWTGVAAAVQCPAHASPGHLRVHWLDPVVGGDQAQGLDDVHRQPDASPCGAAAAGPASVEPFTHAPATARAGAAIAAPRCTATVKRLAVLHAGLLQCP